MKRQIITIIIALVAMTAGAQEKVTLQGSIQDSFLERGLFDCTVTLMRADSTAVECQPKVYEIGNDEMHISTVFYIDVPRQAANYIIRVQKDGYEDGWAKVSVPDGYKEKTLVVPMARIKVKMRGDTLVYDATAFQLPEGSMLQHLIEQLPGARMTDAGEIFINGRKIDELTLNSRTLFKGNKKVLLENLPYFTVKELKVFERQSLYSAIKGIKDENPEYVMDVNLKDEYSVGVIANAEAAGGTHERYQARAFGLLLTKTLTVGAFGNLNNINDISRSLSQGWHEGQGLIMGNQNKPSTRKAAGMSLDYQSTKKMYYGFPAIQDALEIAFDHYDDLDESGTYQERFLPTGTAFAQNMRTSRNKMTAVQVIQQLVWLPWLLGSNIQLYYRETDNSMLGTLQQWDSLQFAISKNIDGMILSSWERTDREAFNRQHSTAEATATDYFRHEYEDASTTRYRFEPSLTYGHHLWKQLHMSLTERYQISGSNSNDQLYMLNDLAGWGLQDSTAIDLLPSNRDLLRSVYDTENSTRSRLQQQENEFTVALRWNKTEHFPVDVTLSLPVYAQHERLDYERGAIDTLARHNLFTVNPSLHLKHKVWSLRVGMTTSTPGLMNLMPYRDARNALSIMEGNPSLKNNRRVNASITWSPKLASRHTGLTGSRIESRYVYHIRSVAQGFTYDEQTSAYTYRRSRSARTRSGG